MIQRLIIFVICLLGLTAYVGLNPVHPENPVAKRWLKINASGEPMHNWSGPWACVYDKKTGLLWEVKSDAENVHDAYWSYSWFDGRAGTANKGDCYFEEQGCDTQDLIDKVNAEARCGSVSWRLPTPIELQTLIFHQAKAGEPKIATGFFPHTKPGDYWTSASQQALSERYKHLGFGATAINFSQGKSLNLPYSNAAFARLVTKTTSHGNR